MASIKLNRQMVLEAPQRVPDSAGGYSETWAELGRLWVELRARSGREVRDGETSLSRTGFRILVRAVPHGAASRPSPEQRFREGARVFRIRSVAEYDSRGQYLSCLADEEIVT